VLHHLFIAKRVNHDILDEVFRLYIVFLEVFRCGSFAKDDHNLLWLDLYHFQVFHRKQVILISLRYVEIGHVEGTVRGISLAFVITRVTAFFSARKVRALALIEHKVGKHIHFDYRIQVES